MSMTYSIDRDSRVVRLDYDSNPSRAEAEEVLRRVLVDSAYGGAAWREAADRWYSGAARRAGPGNPPPEYAQ
jgi:hypothetical protein